ncbi:LuxR C-terminal-related transcriptional regulator [Cellulomonas endophytica]|uniref:LuxR C-terminal-related transcriptional regulator n=1 Tax=Cellulomonas endophytica TaxID=2494735 RepID=UPI0010129D38|nr:LuxR C-terminal-related transcriptional regulator [Cellulomonas endophytica]
MSTMVQLREPATTSLAPGLTRRERVVLAELGEDVTLEEIATRLFVTRNTVKSQVRSVYKKIGASTRSEAVAWAVEHGIR